MDAQARDELKRVLDQHNTFFVATSNDDKPWITGLYFGEEFVPVAEGSDQLAMRIYCTVLNDTRKLNNLKVNPVVSFYIGPLEPTEVIQGMGVMEVITDPDEAAHAIKVLVTKAPPAQMFIDNLPVTPVILRPTEVKLANYWEPDKNRRYWLDHITGLEVAPPPFPPPPASQPQPQPVVASVADTPAAPATTADAPKVAELGKGSGLGWVNEKNAPAQTLGERARLLLKATRAGVLLVMMLPVLFGAALSFAFNRNAFNLWLLLLTLVGAGAAHLASNTVNDYWDYKSGADTAADETPGGVGTHSGVLTSGVMTLKQVGGLTAILFAIALACGIALSLLVGPWVLVFAVAGFLFAYFYVAPPIAYGYIGHGLGEIGVLFSFGVLPVMGSYYVQSGQVSWLPFFASLPLGLLTTAILFNHSFLQWQADAKVHKNTPVVTLGPDRALTVSSLIIAAAYVAIALNVLLGYLPWYALVALITVPVIVKGLQSAGQIKALPGYGSLMAATFKADVNTALLLIAALIVAAFVGGSFLHLI